MTTQTRRLFHEDAYRRRFEAQVLDCLPTPDGGCAVILDQTAFYPTSGGQPHDTGILGGLRVLEVVEVDEALQHHVPAPLSDRVSGEIDWPRRFDHMQQHTGQHVLSQAFIETASARTVSFHLGVERATIDLARADLDDGDIARVEERANGIVQEDREVLVHVVPPEEIDRFPLRRPPQVDGPVRVIEVRGFDWSPCGGTHVARTGEIGLIKVLRRERYKGGSRIEFLCGARAVADYAWKHDLVRRTAERLSISDRELGTAIERLEETGRGMQLRLRAFAEERLEREAAELAARAPQRPGFRLVRLARPVEDPGELKGLALRLQERPGLVALLGGAAPDGRAHLAFSRSNDVVIDVAVALRMALPSIEGRGGGRPEIAQGSGPRVEGLEEALDAAEKAVADPTAGMA